MSIDNYAVERLDDTLDDIESISDSIDMELDDRVEKPRLGDELRDLVSKARGYLTDIEDYDEDDDMLELDPYDLPSADVQDFKSRVLEAIPSGASMKFRMDVEEMLERFTGVY